MQTNEGVERFGSLFALLLFSELKTSIGVPGIDARERNHKKGLPAFCRQPVCSSKNVLISFVIGPASRVLTTACRVRSVDNPASTLWKTLSGKRTDTLLGFRTLSDNRCPRRGSDRSYSDCRTGGRGHHPVRDRVPC